MAHLFALGSLLVAPFWLLMVLAPRWRWTVRLVQSPFIVAGPMALYALLVGPRLLELLPLLVRPQLPAIAALLGGPAGATIAWAHFLALDLFAARWMFLDARGRGLPPAVMAPLLVLTLLFAPLGLGAYLVLQAAGPERLGRVLRTFARQVWAGSRPLALVTVGSAVLLAVSLALQLVDHRQVVGAPVWMKPAKFGLSVTLAAPVLAWIVGQLAARRGVRVAAWLIATTLALELAVITAQAVRGVPSHFNNATPLDAALFGVMGTGVIVLWLAEGYLALRTFRQRFRSPARTWAIRLGLAGALLGGAVGGLMPRPTAPQLASLRAGRPTPVLGAHAVGVADGGPGLPLTGWSSEGGDLRVPHFLGLHALQLLPLLALVIERRRRGEARLVMAGAAGWLGLVGVTLWQALRGQPLLAPDAATLTALAVVAAIAVALAAGPSLVGRRAALSARAV
jgi:hypothetical protein